METFMNVFVWVLYHNQEIGWMCAIFISYQILKETNGNPTENC